MSVAKTVEELKAKLELDLSEITSASRSIEEMASRMEQRQALIDQFIIDAKLNTISDEAILCWRYEDVRCYLTANHLYGSGEKLKKLHPYLAMPHFGKYNGYAQFDKLPLVAPGYKGIAEYVHVHGGITYFRQWHDGSCTYGFDTSHAWSGEIPDDIEWMMSETEAMVRGIRIAARFEPYYLNARTEERKAVVLTRMDKFMNINVGENMGVMMRLLSGDL